MRAYLLWLALGMVTVVGCASSGGGSAPMAPNMMGKTGAIDTCDVACSRHAKPVTLASNSAESMAR